MGNTLYNAAVNVSTSGSESSENESSAIHKKRKRNE
jgi:hypothetical protein